MKRCIGLAVALMAIFKAGGVFLPLDPGPPDRAAAGDAGRCDARRGLGAGGAGGSAAADRHRRPTRTLVVPDDGGEVPREPLAEQAAPSRPDQLAYLIYTSGSTGTPKAAQLMHGGLSNHVLWMIDALELTASDRVLQKTSSSFDASLWEFFSPLCCGATLVIAEPDVTRTCAGWPMRSARTTSASSSSCRPSCA